MIHTPGATLLSPIFRPTGRISWQPVLKTQTRAHNQQERETVDLRARFEPIFVQGIDGEIGGFMTSLSRDTSPKAQRVQIELLRQAPPWRKLHMVAQMNQTLRDLALSGLRQRHPHASAEELRRRLADLLLGPELAMKVYGSLDEKETRV